MPTWAGSSLTTTTRKVTTMFGPQPTPQPGTPEADLAARWLPTEQATQDARRALHSTPEAVLALVPLYQPGKAHGIWVTGQQVETVPHMIILCIDHDRPVADEAILTYSQATHLAEAAGLAHLGNRAGTTAYALVDRAGHVIVFEGYATAEQAQSSQALWHSHDWPRITQAKPGDHHTCGICQVTRDISSKGEATYSVPEGWPRS